MESARDYLEPEYKGTNQDLRRLVAKVKAEELFERFMEQQILDYFINRLKIHKHVASKGIVWSNRLKDLKETEKILLNHSNIKALSKVRKEIDFLEPAERIAHEYKMRRKLSFEDNKKTEAQILEAVEFWRFLRLCVQSKAK